MTGNYRPVADRLKSLEPALPEANLTLAGAQIMYKGIEGKEFHCTISGYRRTRIFEFPRIYFQSSDKDALQTIYSSTTVQASIASNLVDFFVNSTCNDQYAISPSLRHEVSETASKIESQQKGQSPVYLVVEESNQLTPVEMVKGECSISDEVVVRDGEKIPILVGGREGQQFLTAWATVDGAWPELPNNEHLVNLILAGVRAGQQTADPIRKYLDQNGLVTQNGRFVEMLRPTMSARVSTATPMDANGCRDRASQIRSAIAAMEQEASVPHLALLFNSMYYDEYKDDAYQRLRYLQLCQSLLEAGPRHLNSPGDVRTGGEIVAGNKTLMELYEYRGDIAHWWTDTLDENYLADLQRTINELIRRKYFLLPC